MELELGLALPSQGTISIENEAGIGKNIKRYPTNRKKRLAFVDDDDDGEVESKSSSNLSLLLWSGQPNDHSDKWNFDCVDQNNFNDDEEELVGWPPVNSVRKEMMYNNSINNKHHNNYDNNVDDRVAVRSNSSTYVKVKMEGVPIGRKIDLSQYDSYQALSTALINMFAKYADVDGDYRILYQDREGDWMLAGDVPWRSFVESVQRMEIHTTE